MVTHRAFYSGNGISFTIFARFTSIFLNSVTLTAILKFTFKSSKFRELPMVGIYVLRTPALLLRDPVLVKQVLITKFNSFRNNDSCYQMDGESDHVFGNNPFILKDDAWKVKRHQVVSAMSPARVLFSKFVASYYSFRFYIL
jgi:hypothetical protein